MAKKARNIKVEVKVRPAHIERRSCVKTKIKIPRLIRKIAKNQCKRLKTKYLS